jgi:hypothetical protein
VELDQPCEIKCVTTQDGRHGVLTIRKWRFQIDVDDDRAPRPQTPQFVEVCSGSGKWLDPVVQDCSGQEVPFYVEGPDQVLWGQRDLKVCLEGQVCPEGESECRYAERPSAAILRFEADAESIQEGECTNLRWRVDADIVQLNGATVPPEGSVEVCPTRTTPYTLVGYNRPGGSDGETVYVEVTAAATPAPTGEPTVPPGPTGPPVIRIWLGGRERDGVVVFSDHRCVWLEWEVQNATTVLLAGEPVGATGEEEWCLGLAFEEATYTFIAEGPGGMTEKSFTLELW